MHLYSNGMHTKLICSICFDGSLFTNQVTNVLTEVVPFCKSGQIYIYIYIRYYKLKLLFILGMVNKECIIYMYHMTISHVVVSC